MEEVKPSLAKSNISIAYKAERSVSDEIERQSSWGFNSRYIIIAYLVMFVYVTFAFSEFFSLERIMVIKKLQNNIIFLKIEDEHIWQSLYCFVSFRSTPK